ncbi:hypothetical protein LV82_01364 [Albidovulum inexpectatum]|uniref:Ketoreductase domain-containing protein n=1 Tax=Albidovulum inexpectatum TaxID=196587 RepID=A0A2S5JIW9_9RHOB|nr:SDR family oxidoreductase [Albidovulum inexpectatum]PPB81318.1 hypothetical protein LV82_01364 [Albidovulum inexpectatum]
MASKWTMITGASSGLGVEFARLAAAEGRDLILVARRAERMERLAEELRARHGIAVEVIPTDLTDPEAVERLWRQASMRRHIEILVNNAGLGQSGAFAETDPARDRDMILVNIAALTQLTKRAIPHMLRQGGGRVLNVGSVAGFMPGPNLAVYHATKAYVLSLGVALAEELRGSAVTVTTLCPGATATEFAEVARMQDAPLFRLMRPTSAEKVAASGWKAMKRGKTIHVTGLLNRLFAFSSHLLPRRMLARITAMFLRGDNAAR